MTARRAGPGSRLAPLLALLLVAGCAAKGAYDRGRDFATAQDWDQAVYYYSKALALEPQNIEYRKGLDLAKVKASQQHLELAKAYMAAGALDLAIIEYRVAATLDPTNRFVADSLENATQRKKELDEAPDEKTEIEKLKEETRGSGPLPILRPSSQAPLTLTFPPNTKVKDIYVALGKAAGINVLFDQAVRDQETFSIDIANISFKKALDQVALANKHFYKVIDEKTIMVVPDNPQKRRDYEDHVIKTFYLSNANPNDVVNTLRGLLDARRIATNAPLNAITIRDTPAKIAIMERVIESNDKPPSEVVIDVEILEVRKTRDLTYGTTLSQYSVTHVLEQPDQIGSVTGLRVSSIPFINASDWLLSFPSALYQARSDKGNVRTLARPSLRALDGKQVTLRLGDQVPIETSTFSAVGSGAIPLTRNFQFRDIGTNIDITPRVHHNGEVTLQLQVEVTSQGTDPDGASGAIPPTFGNRRINTEIRLKDGETNLLAGLFTSNETSNRSGFPILSDLPVLRTLFANNSRSRAETDIVLTLTPHIVRTPNIRRQDLEPFYVGTESNVGGTTDVALGSVQGGSPFTPTGEDEGTAPAGGAPGGRPVPPVRPGVPGGATAPGGFPGRPSGTPIPPGAPVPPNAPQQPTPFNPEPTQPSPTGLLPGIGGGTEAAEPALPVATAPPTTPTPPPAAPAVVSIAPAAQAAAVDQEFALSVVVAGGSSVGHAPFWINYDPAVLEALAVTEGGFLNQDGSPTQFLSNIQPGAGRIAIGLSRLGRGAGVDGGGALAVVRFRAKAAGSSPITFTNASLRDAQSRPLPATFVPGVVTVR